MSNRTPIIFACALALLPAFGMAARGITSAPQDPLLRDSDHKKLGGALADYFEARTKNSGTGKAKEDLRKDMTKLEKKLKGVSLLSSPADLGRVFWHAAAYDKVKLKKGKVTMVDGKLPGGAEYEFAAWAPSKYTTRRDPYPLVLCIPDAGMDPKEHLAEQWVSQEMRDHAILVCTPMPADAALWDKPGNSEGWGGVAYVLSTMKAATAMYAVDFDKVYIAGNGAGVAAALSIGNQFPTRFAGVIGRAGDSGDIQPNNFKHLATYFSGGGAQVSAFAKGIGEAGYDNCQVQPDGAEKDVWEWMTKNKRNAYPTEIVLEIGAPYPNRAYWLKVTASDSKGGTVLARCDRGSNKITVEANGVSDVILYLNDEIVDLDKPVTVICNGVESVALIPRDFNDMLDFVYQARSDPGSVYVASNSYAVKVAASDEEDK